MSGKRKYDYDKILEYIIGYKKEYDGLSPSLRDIMAYFDISSTCVASHVLKALESEGKIIFKDKYISRGYMVVGGEWRMK